MRLVLMKKVYEDMCDEDRFASDRVLRRRALQSYLLYDARGTAAIFGLPGKSTGEGSISSINTACAHRIGRGQVWIPCAIAMDRGPEFTEVPVPLLGQ